jgi:hypothetical protein
METTNDAPLLKRTLLMVAAMVGACVAFVGTLCLVALLIVGKAVGPAAQVAEETNDQPAGAAVPGAPGGAAGRPTPTVASKPGAAPIAAPRTGRLL